MENETKSTFSKGLIISGDKAYRESYPISRSGLNKESLAMRLLEVRYDVPVSFDNDLMLIDSLSKAEKDAILGVLSMFLTGKEALARESVTLTRALDKLGYKEEVVFSARIIQEEFEHLLIFRNYIDKVFNRDNVEELMRYNTSFAKLIYEILPRFSYNLEVSPSEENLIKYITAFFLGLEGIDAFVGYFFFKTFFNLSKELKDLNNIVIKACIEDSRHITFGSYLLGGIIRETIANEFFLEYFSYVGGISIRALSDFINYQLDKWRDKREQWGNFFKWIYEENGFEKLILFSSKLVRNRLRMLDKIRLNYERLDKMSLEELGVLSKKEDVERFLRI